MNGKVATRIRKGVYGAQSYRIKRRYQTLSTGAIVNVGLRRTYQLAKKEYKRRYNAHEHEYGY